MGENRQNIAVLDSGGVESLRYSLRKGGYGLPHALDRFDEQVKFRDDPVLKGAIL